MAADDTVSNCVLLQEKLPLYPASKGVHHVAITQESISLSHVGSKTNKTIKVNFADVIGCDCMKGKKKDDTNAYVTVYAYPHKKKFASKKTLRQRETLILVFQQQHSFEENFRAASTWKDLILSLSRKLVVPASQDMHSLIVPASKKYLVLVNPHSGPGKSLTLFKERAVPMLAEAGVQYQMVVTEYAGHAKSMMQTVQLKDWDGIVIVSGDGLVYEVINGLMARPDWEEAIKIPVGALPGGSGNALCSNLNYVAKEPYLDHFFLHSTFMLAKQQPTPMDLVAVDTVKERLYSFLAVAWGLVSDVDIESEKFRALGSARFTLGAFVRIAGLRKYRGRLSFLPVNKYERPPRKMYPKRSQSVDLPSTTEKAAVLTRSQSQMEPVSTSSSAYSKTTRSVSQPGTDAAAVDRAPEEEEENGADDLVKIQEKDTDDAVVNLKNEAETRSPHTCTSDPAKTTAPEDKSTVPTPFLNPLNEPVPEDWVTVEDDFVFVLAVYLTHISQDSIAIPSCKLDEGVIHLAFGRGAMSRMQILALFTAMSDGKAEPSYNAELLKVKAFRLEPLTPNGILTVDGERVEYGPIQAQILPSMARVMTLQK